MTAKEKAATAEAVKGKNMSKQETIKQPEGAEQRRLRLGKARLDTDAEEAAIVATEKAERDAAVKAEMDRLDSRGAELRADVGAKCARIAEAMRPLVAAWNAAIDAGAAAVLYRVFGFSEPGSGKVAHLAAGHSIQANSRRLTEADVGYIAEAIEELRVAGYADIEERVQASKFVVAQD